MFTTCRRGPVSICRISKTASSLLTPVVRTSTFSLSRHNTSKPAIASRCLHTSSAIGYNSVAYERKPRHEEPQEQGRATITDDGPAYTKFRELADNGLVHPAVIKEITHGMGHQTMTPVQTLTINQTLKGVDTIAQARTGTGKTLGFLIPVVQNVLNNNPELAEQARLRYRAKPSDIRAIIMSPTRELAEQIAVEARKITRSTGIKVQVAVGGNSKSQMLRQMQREGCHLLVATPGRLHDLLTDPYSEVSAPDLSTFVLDEADRLLDSGFADDIEEIERLLPDRQIKDRQTLLFSATVPREVMGLVRRTLKPNFQFVQTVQEGEQATHEKVPQKVVNVGGFENLMPTLLELCKREIEKIEPSAGNLMPFKAIVYFNSTSNVELAASIFENLKGSSGGFFGKHPLWPAEISEMHGRLSQMQRTRVSGRFRRAQSAIMFSSDVTARGMDFPNVTHVIQVGLPPNRDQYIHRVGRTGRGDKPGEGWILLTSIEEREARYRLKGLPIVRDESLQAPTVDMTREAQLPAELATILSQVSDATKMVNKSLKTAAYSAVIGTMQSIPDKQAMIDALNQWSRFGWGWESPPPIGRAIAQRLGLSRVRGLVIGDGRSVRDEDDGDSKYGLLSRDRDRGRSSERDPRGWNAGRQGGSDYRGGRRASGHSQNREFRDRGGRSDFGEPRQRY